MFIIPTSVPDDMLRHEILKDSSVDVMQTDLHQPLDV
jgi:hypothetical protein